ncbi:hypothetical protein LBMAG55_12770 [Verrucomicrobiota bacterium]|nr:hypothetical protein EMGBD4_11550 [Verrucomicrobiota bacterium]GDY17954.1 hypothetical protein LBMAG55_12770 [Verrucomicrobiota bacterium]
MKTLLLPCLLLLAACAAGPASGIKPYPLKTCLVTDNDLDSMGERTTVVREGRELKFCCEPCVGKFDKNPATYLPKLAGK